MSPHWAVKTALAAPIHTASLALCLVSLYWWWTRAEFESWLGIVFVRWPILLLLSFLAFGFSLFLFLTAPAEELCADTDSDCSDAPTPTCHSGIVEGRLELVDIEGRGKGFRAAKAIKKGEPLLLENALVSCCGTGSEVIEKLADKCSGKKRAALSTLTCQSGWDSRLQGILANNAFMSLGDPTYTVLLLGAARFNHSCCPNAYTHVSKTGGTVRALQDIDIGQEVCVSYVGVGGNREERHRLLQEHDFVCVCARCIQEAKEDPQFQIACRCKRTKFDARVAVPRVRSCPKCKDVFDFAKSAKHWQDIKDVNALMRSEHAASAPPSVLLGMFVDRVVKFKTEAPSVAPPAHSDSRQLLANASDVAFKVAQAGSTRERTMFLATCRKMGFEQLSWIDANVSSWTNQRDTDYLERLHRMLQGDFMDASQRESCKQKLETLCLLHYGQRCVKDVISNQ